MLGVAGAGSTAHGLTQRHVGSSRVVLAYDGGISARQGLTWVPHVLSHAPGSRAIVLHVQDPNEKPRSALARKLGNEELDELVRSLATAGVDARPLLVAGDPSREIPRAVTQLKADLLITGSRGRGPFGRKVMGSVADALVRQTDTNLLVARTGAPPAHVLLATDASMDSIHACRFGAQLAQRWAVPATVLHVRPTEEPFPPTLAADILPRSHEGFECLVRAGEAAPGIVAGAAAAKAGLIVMGRRGATRPDVLVGSTAAKVAKEALASVLLLRRPPQA